MTHMFWGHSGQWTCKSINPLLSDEQPMINPGRDTLTELLKHICELTVRIYRTSCQQELQAKKLQGFRRKIATGKLPLNLHENCSSAIELKQWEQDMGRDMTWAINAGIKGTDPWVQIMFLVGARGWQGSQWIWGVPSAHSDYWLHYKAIASLKSCNWWLSVKETVLA